MDALSSNVDEKLDPGIARRLLAESGGKPRKIGVELELSLLQAESLTPAPFEGPKGIEQVLKTLLAGGDYTGDYEAERLIGLSGSNGEAFSLEPGGQIEFSTAPYDTLAEVEAALHERTVEVAAIAEGLGLYLVGGGIVLHPARGLPWMPKGRYAIMREYFASLGEAGQLGHTMMQRTLSLQISLDFDDAADALDLLRISLLAAPAATALFACSPFDGYEEAECASLRAKAWLWTDPSRAQDVVGCTSADATLGDYTKAALDTPMMFRVRQGTYLPMHGGSFREAMERGTWADGDAVTQQDWWAQLGSIFTNARLKKGVVELRSTDAQGPEDLIAVPAFWVGLLYDDTARAAARHLLSEAAPEVHAEALTRAPCQGMDDLRLREQALALVELAQAGIERRVEAGLESKASLDALRPTLERARAGVSPSSALLEKWRGEWNKQPQQLVAALRYPTA